MSPKPKTINRRAITGQIGIAVAQQRLLEMGLTWHPTNAGLEGGIDGHIELRDQATGEIKNVFLPVQVKTISHLQGDAPLSFQYLCDSRDLDYWMRGNAPVLLVIVHEPSRQAWWVSIKDWFNSPERRQTRRVVFDKAVDRLDRSAADRILSLAQRAGSGVYFVPPRKREDLDSNLFPIIRFPAKLYSAETTLRLSSDVQARLRQEVEYPDREWILTDKRIVSVHPLRESPWTSVCDRGSVESIETAEWASSPVPQVQRHFVWLLNACLTSRLARMRIAHSEDADCFYFKASKDGPLDRKIRYEAGRRGPQTRTVVRVYMSKKNLGEIIGVRHFGFEHQFQRFDKTWYLQVNPRYVFTSDGMSPHPYREELLAGIKRLERNRAVRAHVLLLARLLQDESGLFQRTPYPHLGFGPPLKISLDAGIEDASWAANDELQDEVVEGSDHEGLFQL